MKNQTLSIKQMQHLQKLGVDTSNASMVLIATDCEGYDKDWEVRRKNVDETKALLHEEIYNELVPQVEPLSEEGEPIVYPYPLLDNQMVEALLETSEWSNIDE